MCRNRVNYGGSTMICGSTITRLDSNGVKIRETVHCYSCVRDAALLWNIRKSHYLSAEFLDFDAPDEYGLMQAA